MAVRLLTRVDVELVEFIQSNQFTQSNQNLQHQQNCLTAFTFPVWFPLSLTLGSFIFLAIEGGASQMHQRTLASTNRQVKSSQRTDTSNLTAISKSLFLETFEARQRTVESIWEITVSLNILYRENWTR